MNRKKIYLFILTLLLFGLMFLGWWLLPHYYIFQMHLNRRGEVSGDYVKPLAACGRRAITPIITKIKEESPFVRGYCYLPMALADIGEPAHKALKEEIRKTTDSRKKLSLIYTLAFAFKDLSEFDEYLRIAQFENPNSWIANHMLQLFHYGTPLCENKIDNKFIKWWEENNKYLYWSSEEYRFVVDAEAKQAEVPTEEYRKTNPWPPCTGVKEKK
ncbi:MAG: hypothetical protein HZA49_08365 [Planctomycetes bacterium]|nr:hypothetical protein [Planctomycetota bacterium]